MPKRLSLPGLDSHGDEARTRLEQLAAQPEAEVVERLCQAMLSIRALGLEAFDELALAAGLPLGEVVASPFGLRAVAMGVAVGGTTVHRELRQVLTWPAMDAVADPEHGAWDRGRLHIGKYQAFAAEEPLATYDPSQGPKWAPHELMHRAVGFWWSESPSRWELYLGARLNELLPVVLWYGPDQVARLDQAGSALDDARTDARVEDARWLTDDEAALRVRIADTTRWLFAGLEHFFAELGAIDREIRSGHRVPVVRRVGGARLDASSDATAYVAAHWDRLTLPDVHRVCCQRAGAARTERIAEYRDRIVHVFDALLHGELHLEYSRIAELRAERLSWDLEHRHALTDDAEAAERNGAQRLALGQLELGARTALPRTCELLDDERPAWVTELAEHRALWRRARLGERVVELSSMWPAWLADLGRFEAALGAAKRDDGVEHLGCAIENGAALVASDAFEVLELQHDVLELHAGEGDAIETPSAYLVGGLGDDVVVITASKELLDVFLACRKGRVPLTEIPAEIGAELVEIGALRVVPPT